MTAGGRGWLLAVLAAALLCALADGLMPEGAVKRVGRLTCGLALLCAVLSPLRGLELAGGRRWLENYLADVELREGELREQMEREQKSIIEERLAAYIVDKAAELGVRCSVRVECRTGEEGLPLPDRVWVSGPLSPEERDRLSRLLGEELGLPPEGLRFDSGEAPL